MDITKKKAEESVAMIEEEKNKNETAHFQAMENVQKELNKIDIELKKTLEENDKTKQDHIEKMQEIEFKLAEKEQEILDVNKSLSEKTACLNTTEQDLKSIRQDKLNLEEDLESLRRDHAEEMDDLVDVVNDLRNKEEELAQMKLFQEVQATELTKVRKDFHKLERDSKATLEKTESRAKKDLQAANTKIEDLQGQIKYLNESMGNMKVDHDLQLEKMKKEKDHDGSAHVA